MILEIRADEHPAVTRLDQYGRMTPIFGEVSGEGEARDGISGREVSGRGLRHR